MSEYSIEHNLIFNTAKRILRFVAPDFRVIARDDIVGIESKLDLGNKTIEVPEGHPFMAAGMIIFNAGLLNLRSEESNFSTVFGKIPSSLDDDQLVELAAREHADADELAYAWAVKTMSSYFPELEDSKVIDFVDHRISYRDWLSYFSS